MCRACPRACPDHSGGCTGKSRRQGEGGRLPRAAAQSGGGQGGGPRCHPRPGRDVHQVASSNRVAPWPWLRIVWWVTCCE
eukprot:6506022-Prymnesium_polylepis.1